MCMRGAGQSIGVCARSVCDGHLMSTCEPHAATVCYLRCSPPQAMPMGTPKQVRSFICSLCVLRVCSVCGCEDVH